MTDSLAEKSLPTCIRSRYDKTSCFIRTWIVFAFLLAFLCVNSYASEDDLGTELNDVKSALESLLEGIESLEAVPAVEPNLKDEAVVEKAKPEKIFDPVVGIEIKAADQDQAYILVDFETDDHGWIAAGSGQGKFEIGVPIPFDPCEGSCLTDCFGTGPSEDHSATGVKAACTNLDGYLAPKETLYTNRLNSPVYDFSGCSNVTLELWRFMEIEGRNSDFCYFQYKNDPLGKWITFETYGDIEVDDDEWDIYTKDFSSAADGKSYFQLRFYCTTDGWTEGSGLCLDDIMISWSRDDEPQSLLPRPTEFDTGSEGMTDPLIAEYEQEIATFKAEAEKKEVKAETQVSEPEVPEEHTQYDDPNSINSALAALIEQLKDVEPATEAKPKVESEIIKEKTRFEEEAKLKTEDRLQAQGSSELEEAQETTDILKVEYEQEIIKSKTKTLYQAKRLKAEEEKKEYFFVGFETDDHGWIAAGSGQGKFEIGKPVPFEPNEGDCQTACFGTGPSQDQSALGVNAACTNLDGHMAPLDTLFTSSLTSPIYDFSGCSNVSLELWRFMEIEGRNSDFCYYQYKNDPAGQWITFETYGDIEVDDDEWDIYTKDLSAVADGKSYFQLRFYCTTDGWTEGSGLCLDDIMISWSRDDEQQALLPRRIEFDAGSEEMTDPLIAEYEQEIATFKAKAERGEFEVKKKVSDAGQSEDGSVASDPNTVKSALAALLLKLEAYDVSIEKERELFAPITRVESTSVSRFIGSVYGEIGKVGGTFDEEPGMLNTILGYNVLNTSAEDGVLLLPTFRVLLKRNKSEYDWGNYADYGVGVAYQKTPFIIGAEGVYRDNFENDDLGGEFFRIWGDYWSLWEADTQNFFSSELSRLWGTRYISFEYDTQEENFITDFNADLNLDLFNFKGFIIGPFAEGAINLDTRDEFWNRYGRIGGGLRIRKGPLNIFLESGYKESFNPNDDEGSFYSIYSGIWFPLN